MHILDTGPIFKFLITDCVQQLVCALGGNKVIVPAAVEYEIFDTPARRRQFKRAAELWPRFPERLKEVLPDDPTDELRQCCRTVLGMDFDEMYGRTKDRGENMAILHAVLLARAGKQVIVVCDEESGSRMIKNQARALAMQHMRGLHVPGGSIAHADTLMLLRWVIEKGGFASRDEFLSKYKAMAALDSALPSDVKVTGLTKSPPWMPDAK